MPHFVETFIDDGYFDMYPAMRALQEVGFRGVVIPDHIPRMGDDPRLGTAFTIGYMKALMRAGRGRGSASVALTEPDPSGGPGPSGPGPPAPLVRRATLDDVDAIMALERALFSPADRFPVRAL